MSAESSKLFGLFAHLFHETRHITGDIKKNDFHSHHHPNPGQMRLVFLLAKKGQLTNSEIVTELNIKPSSASGLVNRLVEGGLVQRQASPSDKRVMLISLTDRGQRFIDSAHLLRDKMSELVFVSLTDEEQAQLFQLLTKLSTSIEANMPEWQKSTVLHDFFDNHEEFREDLDHFGFFQTHGLPPQQ
ncbi:MarR family winged helix-turn-helix transcriptional regulator [Secundilactobacillus collinoides]|uniref:HTH marR-type domain-containing protein n=1 Tax=Secundilactobacillus collinoides DSM 20515 = JCM 1123 TaxID=1423733 RepID=A0A0R2BET4_SECCO|nr:MarR family transcriptional regulator [Secundilactobacillus collinoides]KRM76212.1 hypothetical protein FC82_GL001720 [Secundilactobacillus collinoides DSM 20515 = JCM 1123]